MKNGQLQQKEKIGLYPAFGTSTHDLLQRKIINLLGAKPVRWNEIYGYVSTTFWARKQITFISLLKFLALNFQRSNRNSLFYRGINVSHCVIEYSVRLHRIGKFEFFSRQTFRHIKQAVTFLFGIENLHRKFDIEILIGGDEGYIEGSVLAQFAVLNKIKHIFIKENDRYVAGFKFDLKTLYAGPNFSELKNFMDGLHLSADEFQKYENEMQSFVMGKSFYQYIRNSNSSSEQIDAVHEEMFCEAIVLYLHDFLDNPGIYGKCVFHDQWHWIDESVRIISQNNSKLIIKIHPGVDKSNWPAINLLKEKYGYNASVFFLQERVSLIDMKNAGIKGILTLFGSIIPEAAYLEIPSVSASNHPFVSFSLNSNVTTVSQFRSELRKLCRNEIQLVKEGLKERAVQAFMANRLYYKDHSLSVDLPYDDVNIEIFKTIYPNLPNASSFGVYERREVFLFDKAMAEYVKTRLDKEETIIRDRLNNLLNEYHGVPKGSFVNRPNKPDVAFVSVNE